MTHAIRPNEFLDQLPKTSIIRAADGFSYYRHGSTSRNNTWTKAEHGDKIIHTPDIPLPVTVLYAPGVAA